ncbi:hypothetical protein BJ912DRAFT_1081190 [Pholiota molesta]|nr:hypothetical protein BJ912DRAFT_1081190 [Pholiota molesta]
MNMEDEEEAEGFKEGRKFWNRGRKQIETPQRLGQALATPRTVFVFVNRVHLTISPLRTCGHLMAITMELLASLNWRSRCPEFLFIRLLANNQYYLHAERIVSALEIFNEGLETWGWRCAYLAAIERNTVQGEDWEGSFALNNEQNSGDLVNVGWVARTGWFSRKNFPALNIGGYFLKINSKTGKFQMSPQDSEEQTVKFTRASRLSPVQGGTGSTLARSRTLSATIFLPLRIFMQFAGLCDFLGLLVLGLLIAVTLVLLVAAIDHTSWYWVQLDLNLTACAFAGLYVVLLRDMSHSRRVGRRASGCCGASSSSRVSVLGSAQVTKESPPIIILPVFVTDGYTANSAVQTPIHRSKDNHAPISITYQDTEHKRSQCGRLQVGDGGNEPSQ